MSALAVFNFSEENPVRVQMINDDPWFVAVDICRILGVKNHIDAVSRLDDDERGSVVVDTLGGKQEMSAVSESGLYALVFKSRKPEAKAFRKWVTSEVLPSIRKTGSFGSAKPSPMSMNHRADILVATDRTFGAWLRLGRRLKLGHGKSVLLANEKTLADTGINVMAEAGYQSGTPAEALEPLSSAVRFAMLWLAGDLNLPVICCAINDFYSAYCNWCNQQAEPWPLSYNTFSRDIKRVSGLWKGAKAIRSGDKQGTLRVVIPETDLPEQGIHMCIWLAERVPEFKDALEAST